MATYPPDILRELKDLKRRVQNLETTPQPPNIQLSNTGSAVFDLGPVTEVTLTAVLTDFGGARTLVQPNVTLYRSDPPDEDGIFPDGADWLMEPRHQFFFETWLDWGDTDNNNAVVKIRIVNNSTVTFNDLFLAINMRYMTRGASV